MMEWERDYMHAKGEPGAYRLSLSPFGYCRVFWDKDHYVAAYYGILRFQIKREYAIGEVEQAKDDIVLRALNTIETQYDALKARVKESAIVDVQPESK